MSRVQAVLCVGLVLVLLLGGALSLYEWYRVGVLASPEVLAQYPFGSEGPVAGDPAYVSASAYAHNALHTWLFAFALLCIVLLAAQRRSGKLLAVCYALFFFAWVGRAAGAL